MKINVVKDVDLNLNKSELIKELAAETGVSRVNTEKILDALPNKIMEVVAKGGTVKFMKFGSFQPDERKSKMGRNFHTKESMVIPCTYVPKFKPSEAFCDMVAKLKVE